MRYLIVDSIPKGGTNWAPHAIVYEMRAPRNVEVWIYRPETLKFKRAPVFRLEELKPIMVSGPQHPEVRFSPIIDNPEVEGLDFGDNPVQYTPETAWEKISSFFNFMNGVFLQARKEREAEAV